MWDHIAKPINVGEMFVTLAKWIKPSVASSGPAADLTFPRGRAGVAAHYQNLPGIDAVAGLATTLNNEKLYRRMLLKFRDGRDDFVTEFDAARVNGDDQASERCAHTLKGTAGIIGAQRVAAAAGQLEYACKTRASSDEIGALRQRVLIELATVMTGLQTLDADANEFPSVAPEMASMDADQRSLLSKRLEALLLDDDAEAGDVWDEHEHLFQAAYPVHWQRIAKSLRDFDFESALELLQEASKALHH